MPRQSQLYLLDFFFVQDQGGGGAPAPHALPLYPALLVTPSREAGGGDQSFFRLHFSIIRMGSRGTFVLCTDVRGSM